MADKTRVLAITKCDMLDQELMDEIEPTLPEGIPHVFISAVTGLGIEVLKDILWEELNSEKNRLLDNGEELAHRSKEISYMRQEMEDEGEAEDILPPDAKPAYEDYSDEFWDIEEDLKDFK